MKTEKPIWIELVNNGVANRFELEDHELIEMNWRLTGYPKLYSQVFKHEISHCSGDYKLSDFLHDMKSRTPGLLKFMKNHISSWTQLLPIYWDSKRDTFVYDISAIFSWVLIMGTAFAIFFTLGRLL